MTSYGAVDPLIPEEDIETHPRYSIEEKNASENRGKVSSMGLGVMVVGALLLVVIAVSSSTTKTGKLFSFSFYTWYDDAGPLQNIAISTENAYGATNTGYGMFAYPFLDQALLFEPYRDTTVTILNEMKGCTYSWSLTSLSSSDYDVSGAFVASASQISFTLQPTKPGQYDFKIDETCHGGDTVTRSYYRPAWVKYIRRELTTLNDEDREEFLDAFHTLWTLNTVDGQQLYGDNYKSLFHLAVLHNDAGANSVCDEFHGGYGFINNHIMLSAYLEQSLQLVNPRVALHYMEYTKYFEGDAFQSHVENQLDGGIWTELLTEKWFGSSDPYTGEILDGRWAHSPVPRLDGDFFQAHGIEKSTTYFPDEQAEWLEKTDAHLTSPYGLLRAPWNFNPANFTVRYNNVFRVKDVSDYIEDTFYYFSGVDCTDYKNFIEKKVVGEPMSAYLDKAEDDVHGIIHFTFGGMGGDYAAKVNKKLQEDYGVTDECLGESALMSQKFFKSHWWVRANGGDNDYFDCTANPWQNGVLTTTAAPGEEGGPTCSCRAEYFESEDKLNELLTEFFEYGDRSNCLATLSALSFEDRAAAMGLMCSRMSFDGDMAGSGAATDPLFWVAHGAVERLFQRTVFSNTLTDTTFPDTKSARCSGHDAYAPKTWMKGLKLMDDTLSAEKMSNKDIATMLVPTSEAHRDYVNFVYDTSDFTWCTGLDKAFKTEI